MAPVHQTGVVVDVGPGARSGLRQSQEELREVLRSLGRPAVLVTHDFEDAAAHCEVAVVHLDRARVSRIEITEVAGEEFPAAAAKFSNRPRM